MATQRDIAETLGVSISLVSRVLSGKAGAIGVTDATIRRIHDAATQMDYVPSTAARVLKGAPSHTVGVVVYDFEDPFFGPIIGELQRLAHREGCSLVLVGFERRHVDQNDLQPLLQHGLDGLVIVGSEPVLAWAEPFIRRGIPIVRIGGGPSKGPVQVVNVDTEEAIDLGLRHLVELGHRAVGFVGASVTVHRHRYEIFLKRVKDAGLKHKPSWVGISSAPAHDAGVPACRNLLDRCGSNRPPALMASSDVVALGAIKTLQATGMEVPRDVSVLGFGDIPLAHLGSPGLTTIRQPISDMARAAFERIRAGRDAPREMDRVITLRPTLIVRESTAPPPKPRGLG